MGIWETISWDTHSMQTGGNFTSLSDTIQSCDIKVYGLNINFNILKRKVASKRCAPYEAEILLDGIK